MKGRPGKRGGRGERGQAFLWSPCGFRRSFFGPCWCYEKDKPRGSTNNKNCAKHQMGTIQKCQRRRSVFLCWRAWRPRGRHIFLAGRTCIFINFMWEFLVRGDMPDLCRAIFSCRARRLRHPEKTTILDMPDFCRALPKHEKHENHESLGIGRGTWHPKPASSAGESPTASPTACDMAPQSAVSQLSWCSWLSAASPRKPASLVPRNKGYLNDGPRKERVPHEGDSERAQ